MNARVLAIATCALMAHATAHAFFFFFIPTGGVGDSCVSSGFKQGDEIRGNDGRTYLIVALSGTSSRCSDPSKPILVTTDRLVSDEARNSPSTQCVPLGANVGDEVVLKGYGRVVVIKISESNIECSGSASAGATKQATVVSVNASRNAPARSNRPPGIEGYVTPQLPKEPTVTTYREFCALATERLGDDHYDGLSPIGKVVVVTSAAPECSPGYPNRVRVRYGPPAEPIQESSPSRTQAAEAPRPSDQSAASIKLRELNQLLKDGIISQQDYDAKKAELLRTF